VVQKTESIISVATRKQKLLVPRTNMVLLRRFSAKEQKRRLTAAPFLAQDFDFEFIGLENHLNYIRRRDIQLGRAFEESAAPEPGPAIDALVWETIKSPAGTGKLLKRLIN